MTKVLVELSQVVIEQDSNTIILSYVEVDKLREDLIRAQIKIKEACKVAFVKEEK